MTRMMRRACTSGAARSAARSAAQGTPPATVVGAVIGAVVSAALAAAPAAAAPDPTAPASTTSPGARPVFLVTEVVVGEGIAIDTGAARDALTARFGRLRSKIDVRSYGEVKSSLNHAATIQLLGGTADEEIAQLGSYIEVDRIVYGRIHRVGGTVELQVKLFNTEEAVTELALVRRIQPNAPPQLLLTVLDGLADRLLAFVLGAYTDNAPSPGFSTLQGRKLERSLRVSDANPWGPLGLAGAGLLGVGAGAAIVGSSAAQEGLAVPMVVGGSAAAIVGTALLAVDGLGE